MASDHGSYADGKGALRTHPPLDEGQIRVLCLQPGEPGSPLRARFDIIKIEDARRDRPDLRSCDPEHLDFDESQSTLRHYRKMLIQRHEIYKDMYQRLDAVESLRAQVETLLHEKEHQARVLHQNPPAWIDVRVSAAEQSPSPDMGDISAERAILQKLKSELSSVFFEIRNWSGDHGCDNYLPLCRVARLLTGVSQLARDSLVRRASSVGSYEALSYTWGSSHFESKLWVEGYEREMSITTAVFEALQHFRYRDQERRLWIDALCINQSDSTERSHQISNMAQIYASAARVIVWLGRPDPSTCLAYGVLNAHLSANIFHLDMHAPRDRCAPHIEQAMETYTTCDFCGDSLPETIDRQKDGITAMDLLGSRAWFTRLWVVQEVASAGFAEVHCGDHRIPRDVFNLLDQIDCELRNGVWDLTVAMDLFQESYSPCVLIWFLVTTSRRRCTLKRDRVFAIQSVTGLTTNEIEGLDQEMDHDELFIRLAEHCLTSRCTNVVSSAKRVAFSVPHVALLLTLAPMTAAGGDLPSWVPDWNKLPENAQDLMLDYGGHLDDRFRFGGWTNRIHSSPLNSLNLMQCFTKNSRKCLSIKGHHLGRIERILTGSEYPVPGLHTSGVEPNSHSPPRWFNEQQKWYHLCKGFAERHWSSYLFEVKLKELLLFMSPRGDDSRYYRVMLDAQEAPRPTGEGNLVSIMRQEVYRASCPLLLDEQANIDPCKLAAWTCGAEYYSGNLTHLHDRKLCSVRTRSDGILLGWVPKTAEVGNLVCLFDGAPRPYIVMSHNEGDGSFTLIGDSWLHDMCEMAISEFCTEHSADLEWIDLK